MTNRSPTPFQPPRWPAIRSQVWQLRTRELTFVAGPAWMAIVNVTPDSFSDGGQYFNPAAAIEQAEHLLSQGADILDIGGESTRPYSEPVSETEELRRVLPVIEAIRQRHPTALISIDTSKPAVAAAAVSAGAEIMNDITGFANPAMIELARATQVGVCAMHMQGTPQTMQDQPAYGNVVAEVSAYLEQRRDALLAAGLLPARICLDPGIGFGKTHEHNLQLMAHSATFHALGCPLLVGHSRKGFIGQVLGDKSANRDAGSLGGALALALQGVQVIRLHQIRAAREAWQVLRASLPGMNPS
ncbi:Dihydropteroate synthase [Anatilimnocola aggregata]|uniref:dihydropteroate synthase n=1 Tax=Anatilimnocola aggregata TaxID=2528021 RepID=A0A517YHW2_9BACT|nr:dihydropteroate synthase [Anatilimnocola aggregata]QDU29806.1 Dihydropteroate synthase [Anatilimnocola aggregata]